MTIGAHVPRTDNFEIFLALRISDFVCPPEEITRILGVEPSRTWLKGQRTAGSVGAPLPSNRWQIDHPFDASRGNDLNLHIASLLTVIRPIKSRFKALPAGARRVVFCAIYEVDRKVWINTSAQTVSEIAEIEASVDIDYYALGTR